jgi:hypothetical protein
MKISNLYVLESVTEHKVTAPGEDTSFLNLNLFHIEAEETKV